MATLNVNQGTTYTLAVNYTVNGEAGDLTGGTVRFTVKDEEFDSDADDSEAQITKDVTSHTDASAGESEIALTPADTDITPGTYFYDIKVENADGDIYKIDEGKFKVDGSPTNRRS